MTISWFNLFYRIRRITVGSVWNWEHWFFLPYWHIEKFLQHGLSRVGIGWKVFPKNVNRIFFSGRFCFAYAAMGGSLFLKVICSLEKSVISQGNFCENIGAGRIPHLFAPLLIAFVETLTSYVPIYASYLLYDIQLFAKPKPTRTPNNRARAVVLWRSVRSQFNFSAQCYWRIRDQQCIASNATVV